MKSKNPTHSEKSNRHRELGGAVRKAARPSKADLLEAEFSRMVEDFLQHNKTQPAMQGAAMSAGAVGGTLPARYYEEDKVCNQLTEQQPQVKSQCERIEALVESLHRSLTSLEDRLLPVMHNIPLGPTNERDAITEPLVPVAAMLSNAAHTLGAAIERVSRLTNLLEV